MFIEMTATINKKFTHW